MILFENYKLHGNEKSISICARPSIHLHTKVSVFIDLLLLFKYLLQNLRKLYIIINKGIQYIYNNLKVGTTHQYNIIYRKPIHTR